MLLTIYSTVIVSVAESMTNLVGHPSASLRMTGFLSGANEIKKLIMYIFYLKYQN